MEDGIVISERALKFSVFNAIGEVKKNGDVYL